jgi:hypothetical protein
MKIRAFITATALVVSLAACGSAPSGLATSPVVDSVGASLINALTDTLAPGLNAAIAEGAQASQADLNTIAYWLPWAQKAVDYFGPTLKMPAADIAAIDAGVAQVTADLANPPSNVGSVVAEAAALATKVTAALQPVTSP